MDKGRWNVRKTICFNLNSAAQKIKISILDVPGSLKLKTIEDYLKKDIKSMFFYFCWFSFKVHCNLDHSDYITVIKNKDTFWVWFLVKKCLKFWCVAVIGFASIN